MYKEGYIRTSSASYSLSAKDSFVHLTNNCLQRNGEEYGQHEDGNTLSFEDFEKYLNEVFPDYGITMQETFMKRAKDIIIDTFLSVKNKLNPRKRKDCFELFGYDFLIDEDFSCLLYTSPSPRD